MVPIARPLYTAPEAELSAIRAAAIPDVHAAIVPSSVANMKCEPPKSPELPLNTCPVGAEGGTPRVGGGTVTTNGIMLPAPLYSVATPVWLSDTQNGEVGANDTPHGLTKFGSVVTATPGISDTRLVCVKLFEAPSASIRCALAATRTIAATTKTMRYKLFSIVFIGLTSCELLRGCQPIRMRTVSQANNGKHFVNGHPGTERTRPLTFRLDLHTRSHFRTADLRTTPISRITGLCVYQELARVRDRIRAANRVASL